MHSQLTDVVMQRQDGHEDRFLSYINASPVAIFVQSAAGQYCDVNPAGERMLGYSKLELEEVSMPQLVAEESLTAAVEHFAKVQSDGIADGEIILKRKDGSRFWARVTASRLDATRFIAFKQDISQQKEYEVELARAKEQAIKANQGKSLFLSNMSHEIRTPLNAIVAMTNVLRFTGMTSEQLHCLNNIELSVDCLIGLISDVLDISRIESGKVELEL